MFHSGTARLGSRSNYWTQRSRERSTVIVFSSSLLADSDDDPCHCILTATLSKSVQAGDCENCQVKGKISSPNKHCQSRFCRMRIRNIRRFPFVFILGNLGIWFHKSADSLSVNTGKDQWHAVTDPHLLMTGPQVDSWIKSKSSRLLLQVYLWLYSPIKTYVTES